MSLPGVGDDDRFMAQALEEAKAAVEHGDVPIGAVVVHEGIVVGKGHNARELDQDPTAHAELIALREAAKTLGRWRLTECALFVTLEQRVPTRDAWRSWRSMVRALGEPAPGPAAGLPGQVAGLWAPPSAERIGPRKMKLSP